MVATETRSGRTPAGHTEVLYWRITGKPGRLVTVNALALPLAVVSGLGFVWAAEHLGSAPRLAWDSGESAVFAVGMLVVLALHEGVHGVLMRTFGARPRYGFYWRGGMFYAKAPGHAFTRGQYLVIVLGPLVGLSLVACGVMVMVAGTPMVWMVALWGVVNASASHADVWITAVVLRCPAAAYVVDEADGLRVLVPR